MRCGISTALELSCSGGHGGRQRLHPPDADAHDRRFWVKAGENLQSRSDARGTANCRRACRSVESACIAACAFGGHLPGAGAWARASARGRWSPASRCCGWQAAVSAGGSSLCGTGAVAGTGARGCLPAGRPAHRAIERLWSGSAQSPGHPFTLIPLYAALVCLLPCARGCWLSAGGCVRGGAAGHLLAAAVGTAGQRPSRRGAPSTLWAAHRRLRWLPRTTGQWTVPARAAQCGGETRLARRRAHRELVAICA